MVNVVCDTSFLMHLATKKIKNISNLETEIGQIQFVVPEIVVDELHKLCENENKKQTAVHTLEYIKKFKKIILSGKLADDAIISHVKDSRGIIATMDIQLKQKIKDLGGSIISVSKDKIVLEPSKI